MHFSPPFRGTFQLSLTVLVHYRFWVIFSLRSYFLLIFDANYQWHLLWYSTNPIPFRLRGYHPLCRNFPDPSTNLNAITNSPNPISLAATLGISIDFFSFRYWDVSLPWVRPSKGNMNRSMLGCPIRKSPDQSFLAAPRGLSQPNTSFVASTSQGIHLWPLLTFLTLIVIRR